MGVWGPRLCREPSQSFVAQGERPGPEPFGSVKAASGLSSYGSPVE